MGNTDWGKGSFRPIHQVLTPTPLLPLSWHFKVYNCNICKCPPNELNQPNGYHGTGPQEKDMYQDVRLKRPRGRLNFRLDHYVR